MYKLPICIKLLKTRTQNGISKKKKNLVGWLMEPLSFPHLIIMSLCHMAVICIFFFFRPSFVYISWLLICLSACSSLPILICQITLLRGYPSGIFLSIMPSIIVLCSSGCLSVIVYVLVNVYHHPSSHFISIH